MYRSVLILYACVLIRAEARDTPSIKLTGGPHGLPREVVHAVQRQRLLDAMAQVVAAEGYQGTTVRRLTARAGLSRKTYYELFGDKEECFLAAYDEAMGRMLAAIVEACAAAEPDDRASDGLDAALTFLAGEPAIARMCVVEALAGGPRVRARRAQTVERLARMLADALGEDEPAGDQRARMLVGGIHELAYDLLERGDLDGLAGLGREVELGRWPDPRALKAAAL